MTAGLLALLLSHAAPMPAPPLPDPELAKQRGGFSLPNGIDVALTVQTQTTVNGAIVLRTVFRADGGTPNLVVYAPRAGESVMGKAAAASSVAGRSAVPSVTVDARNGIQLVPGVQIPAVGSGRDSLADVPAGLTQIDPGSVTDHGIVTGAGQGGVGTVSLEAPDLNVTHLVGTAFGAAIVNAGNDRTIDTQTAVSIGLGNAGPDVLGSTMFRVEDIALASVATRIN